MKQMSKVTKITKILPSSSPMQAEEGQGSGLQPRGSKRRGQRCGSRVQSRRVRTWHRSQHRRPPCDDSFLPTITPHALAGCWNSSCSSARMLARPMRAVSRSRALVRLNSSAAPSASAESGQPAPRKRPSIPMATMFGDIKIRASDHAVSSWLAC